MGNPTTRASRLDYSITQADVPLLRGDNFPATPLSPTSPGDDIKKASDAELDLPAKVDITNGRPDLKLILKEEIELARGSVAVKVSGPDSLISDIRAALRSSDVAGPAGVLRGKASVNLHTEAFRW